MSYRYKTFLWLTPLVLILDQWTKYLVLQHLNFGDQIAVIPGFFDLVHVRNTGAAFGMLATLGDALRIPFFYAVSAIAACILIYAFVHLDEKDRFYPYPLSLIAAGVLGNLIDRFRFGNVVDFVSLHVRDKIVWGIRLEWPAFNVADSAITISMVLLIAHMLKNPKIKDQKSK